MIRKPPKRRSQAERSALSEKMILRAATKLIARQGYSKTTLAQIGKEAGYAAGLVSHRFGSKEGLFRALAERIRGRFHRDPIEAAVVDEIGLDALEAVVDTYLNVLSIRSDRLRFLHVLMGEALGPVPEIRPLVSRADRQCRDAVARWIESGMRAGDIRGDVDPAVEAAVFVGLLRGVATQWITDRKSFDLGAVRGSVKATLRARLAARVPRPVPAIEASRRARRPRVTAKAV